MIPARTSFMAPGAETGSKPRPSRWLTVALPVYNEAGVIGPLSSALKEVCEQVDESFEVLFVDDGSTDGTPELLDDLADRDPTVSVVKLSRNFGQPAALAAAVDLAAGERLIVMDADMQDDPALIPELVRLHRDGAEIVYVVRSSRQENAVRRLMMRAFHWLQAHSATYPIPANAGTFGLIGPQALPHVQRLTERLRYFPGLRAFVGFTQTELPAPRGRRYDAKSRVGFKGLMRLAGTALFSQARAPITLFYALGGLSLVVATGLIAYAIIAKLVGAAVVSWASTIITTSFFGSVIILGQAFICEYLARIYEEVRGRPTYIVKEIRPASAQVEGARPAPDTSQIPS